MKDSIKFSVITISLNSEKTIEDTILSVINQEYDELEYIIIDGGSTDGTLEIISKYKDRISCVVSEKDNGICDAFNKGIKQATGEIIGIINSDDILNKDALKTIASEAKMNPADVYYGDIYMRRGDGYAYRCNADRPIEELRKHFILFHPSCFVRRTAYLKYGMYNGAYRFAMDFELLSRMFTNGAIFYHIRYPLAWFNMSGTSFKNATKTTNESIEICVRNGVKRNKATVDYRITNMKTFLLGITNYIGIENRLRKTLKKQYEYNCEYRWYEDIIR